MRCREFKLIVQSSIEFDSRTRLDFSISSRNSIRKLDLDARLDSTRFDIVKSNLTLKKFELNLIEQISFKIIKNSKNSKIEN